jgi:hypothetical protein
VLAGRRGGLLRDVSHSIQPARDPARDVGASAQRG